MYGKSPKMTSSKTPKKAKGMPVTIMVAVGKPKSMPVRGSRTATNMMKKTKTEAKISMVMREYKAGTLHSGKGGPVVKKPSQALAIALSQSRKKK